MADTAHSIAMAAYALQVSTLRVLRRKGLISDQDIKSVVEDAINGIIQTEKKELPDDSRAAAVLAREMLEQVELLLHQQGLRNRQTSEQKP